MANYDKATQEFISKTVGDVPQKEVKPAEESLSLKPIRVARQILRGIEDPKKTIAKAIIRATAADVMEKSSVLKVLSLYQFMNDHYGREWWDWEPETIWATLEADHLDTEGGTPDEIKSAVMALQLCVNSMAAFEHWHIFEKVGHAFNWNPVDFAIVQPLEPDEAVLTMGLLKRIQPKTAFESEVLYYVAVCAKSAGMVYLPQEWAPGVQEKLDEITFEHGLRDATKKGWDEKVLPTSDLLRYQVEIQLSRLQDVKDLLDKEGVSA